MRDGQGTFQRGASGLSPTDLAKPGTKRSVLAEQGGYPIAAHIDGAYVHDARLLQDTLDAVAA